MPNARYRCEECGSVFELVEKPIFVYPKDLEQWMATPPSCFCGTEMKLVPADPGPVIKIGVDGQPCCAKCEEKDYPLENHKCKK